MGGVRVWIGTSAVAAVGATVSIVGGGGGWSGGAVCAPAGCANRHRPVAIDQS